MKPRLAVSRSAVGSWSSVIGALALVVGALLFVFSGEVSPWAFASLVVGVVGLSLWMWLSPNEMRAFLSGRQTRFGTSSLLISTLFVGFVVAVYGLVDRANITVDLTSVQRYSLNQPSLDTIDQLRERGYHVQITGFFSRQKLPEQEKADLLLRQYKAEGDGVIEIRFVDPDEQPDVAALYGYQPGYDGKLFLNILGPDNEPEMITDLNGNPAFKYSPLYLGNVSERDITTGLRTVASAGAIKIYFTTGHFERDLERVDEIGISRLGASLIAEGIDVAPLDLAELDATSGIPADASAVFIVGARTPFSDTEVAIIKDYMDRGGRLAIFTDPPLVDEGTALTNSFLKEGTPFSRYLWDEFGIRPRDALVIETQILADNPIANTEFTPVVDTIAPHEILANERDIGIILHLARTIEMVTEPDDRQGRYVRQPLLYSSAASYGETGLDELLESSIIGFDAQADLRGPLLMGVTARRSLEFQEDVQPRVVLIGDSDVLKNEFVSQLPGNSFLWTDVVDWLTGFSEVTRFPTVTDSTVLPLVVSDQERRTIAYLTMLVLPGLILLSGAIVWWYRQR